MSEYDKLIQEGEEEQAVKLRNTHPLFTDEKIREMVRFTCPQGITNFLLRVTATNWRRWRGLAWPQKREWRITVRVNRDVAEVMRAVRAHKPKGAYLPFEVYSYEELMVHLIAHELRHLWQAKVKKGYRVWGARGQYSERDADAYAIHKVREWRRR